MAFVTATTRTVRAAALLTAAALVWNQAAADAAVKSAWLHLRGTWWFSNHFFEAWFPLLFFPFCCSVWLAIDAVFEHSTRAHRWLQPYKLQEHSHRSAPATNLGSKFYIGVALYVVPPALLELRKSPRHLRLQEDVPGTWGLLAAVAVNMLIFDTFFFVIHVAFHKVPWLWDNVHKEHHQDTVLRATDANWVSPLERLSLVLSAAAALTITGAHPLVRTLYTMYAIWCLVENHSGWDFPWMLANVVPWDLVSGSARHEAHHSTGGFFAEYFTHWDTVYAAVTGVRRSPKLAPAAAAMALGVST